MNSKGSRRRAAIVPGFESLEERALLSHFSGPIEPRPVSSIGGQGGGSAGRRNLGKQLSGACTGQQGSASPGFIAPQASVLPREPSPLLNEPSAPSDAGSPTSASAAAAPSEPNVPASSLVSAAVPGAGQPVPSVSRSSPQTSVAPAVLRRAEPTVGGPLSLRPPRDPQSEDLVIAAAPGVGPPASSAFSGDTGLDAIGGVAPGAPGLSAPTASIFTGLTAWTVALCPDLGGCRRSARSRIEG